jgi:ParB-like chromosome segregation protein Spo0J
MASGSSNGAHPANPLNRKPENHQMATKSLKAMAAQGDGTVKKDDAFKVDPRVLVESPGFNLRDYDAHDVQEQIEAFARAYEQGQYVPPLLVRVNDDSQVEIVDGHQRRLGALRAIARGAELPYVQVARFYGNNADRIAVMLRSSEGLKLKPLEVGFGYLRLLRMGHSPADIAEKVGRSKARVDQLLLLAQADSDVHAMVVDGTVSAEAALDAVRAHGDKAGDVLKEAAAALPLPSSSGSTKTARVTQKHVRRDAVPQKVVRSVVERFREAAPHLERHAERVCQIVDASGPIALEGMTVEIPARAFHALIVAQKSLFDKVAHQPPTGPAPRLALRAPVKYRHPKTGETWSGRGKRPKWMEVEIARGASVDDFAIAGMPEKGTP